MKILLAFILALFTLGASAAPNTNTITFDWLDFGYQVDSVTNKPVKITPLEYATIGSFFMVKTPRIYTNTTAGRCIVTNMQAGSYRVELATALGSITTFTSTIPTTATGSSNYSGTQFVTNYATNSGSTRSYSITVSDLRYPSTAGSNIVFYTNAGRVTIAGTAVSGTSPAVASNYLWATKLDTTNGNAYNVAFTTNAEWRGPLATNIFMQNGHKFMVRDSRAADCWIEYTNRADGLAPWTFLESPVTVGRSQSDGLYALGDVFYLSYGNQQDRTAIGASDAAFYIYNTNVLHGTGNWLHHDNATDLTTFAGDVTVGGFFVSTNMNAKIAAASNTVHTALNSTNSTLLAAIGTKQHGTLYLTNLAAWGISNIVSANATLTIATNDGVLTLTGNGVAASATNYVATTNGYSRNLTNLGAAYSDRLVVTNLIVGTNAAVVQITNGTVLTTSTIRSTGGNITANAGSYLGIGNGSITTAFGQGNSGNYDEVSFYRSDTALLGMMTYGYGTGLGTPAIHFTNANIYLGSAARNFNTATNPVNVPYVNARLGVLLPAATPFTAPASLAINNSAHLWSDGTNLCIVFQNSAGTRTTNKVTMTAWP